MLRGFIKRRLPPVLTRNAAYFRLDFHKLSKSTFLNASLKTRKFSLESLLDKFSLVVRMEKICLHEKPCQGVYLLKKLPDKVSLLMCTANNVSLTNKCPCQGKHGFK